MWCGFTRWYEYARGPHGNCGCEWWGWWWKDDRWTLMDCDVACQHGIRNCWGVTWFTRRFKVPNLQSRFHQSLNTNLWIGFRSDGLADHTPNLRSGPGSNLILTVREPEHEQSRWCPEFALICGYILTSMQSRNWRNDLRETGWNILMNLMRRKEPTRILLPSVKTIEIWSNWVW